MKHCTTIEQSKKLLEIGLNPESADMFYSHKTVFYNMMEHRLYVDEDDNWHLYQRSEIAFMDIGNVIPCWSLEALLEVMPIIKKGIDEYLPYFIKGSEIWKGEIRSFWYCSYTLLDDSNTELITFKNSTAVEAAYSMAAWLLKNGFIKEELKTSSEYFKLTEI